MDEPAWQQAKTTGDFTFVISKMHAFFKAINKTEVKVLYDDAYIYIGFTCYKAPKDKVIASVKGKDVGFWGKNNKNDCVELFLDANRDKKTYYFFIANAAGGQYDGKNRKSKWNADWKSTGKIYKDKWTIEFAIPLKEIDMLGKELEKCEWGINFARQDTAYDYYSSTIQSQGGGNHDVENFPLLIFEK